MATDVEQGATGWEDELVASGALAPTDSEPVDMSEPWEAEAVTGGQLAPVDSPESPDPVEALKAGAVSGTVGGSTFGLGFSAGFAATPPVLPGVGPLAKPIGGLVAGIAATSFVREPVMTFLRERGIVEYASADEVPPEIRPEYYASEIATEAVVPGAMLAGGVAKLAPRIPAVGGRFKTGISRWVNRVLDTAQRSPKTVLGIEGSSAISAGAFTYESAKALPESDGMRTVAGIAGGMINPSLHIYNGIKWGASKVTGFRRAASTELSASGLTSAQEDASRWLKQLFEEAGGTPDVGELVRLARDSGFLDGKLTLGQKTGDKALLALENALEAHSLKFKLEKAEGTTDALKLMTAQIDDLLAAGDTASLTLAADMKVEYVRNLVAATVQSADNRARRAMADLAGAGTASRLELGAAAFDAADSVRKMAREVESSLWGQVNQQLKIPENLLQDSALLNLHEEILANAYKEKVIPSPILPYIKRLSAAAGRPVMDAQARVKNPQGFWVTPRTEAPAKGGFLAKDLIGFRRDMLSKASAAANANDLESARLYGDYADAALDDLERFMGQLGDTTHTIARTFSREFNGVFTRSFAGRSQATSYYGRRIAPELLLHTAMKSDPEVAFMRLGELEEATRFLDVKMRGSNADDPVGAAVRQVVGGMDTGLQYKVMMNSQEQILRIAAGAAVDETTGRINPKTLARFKGKRKLLMSRFPGVSEAIDRAIASETELRKLEKLAPKLGKTGKGTFPGVSDRDFTVATKIAEREDPSAVVKSILNGANPSRGINALADMATQAGGDAVAGLRTSLMDVLKANGVESFVEQLKMPLIKGGVPLIEQLKTNGILTPESYQVASKFVEEISRVLGAGKVTAVSKLPGQEKTATNLLQRALVRMGALHGAAKTPALSGGPASLALASTTSNLADKLLSALPEEKVIDALVEGMINPDLGALMLKNMDSLSEADVFRLGSRVHGYLFSAGIIPHIEEENQ